MRLKDTGLTVQDIKDKVNKYMIETYERFDFLAETAEGMYMYDENGTPYLDFYAGIAVNNAGNRNPKVVAAAKEQLDDIMHTFNYPYTIPQALHREIRTEPLPHRNRKDGLPWKNLRCHVCNRSAGQRMPGWIRTDDLRFLLCTVQ